MPTIPVVAVVPDTNILFSPDKTRWPGTEMRKATADWRGVAATTTYLPEIVLWELRHQYVSAANATLQIIRSKNEALSKILEYPQQTLIPEESVVPLVEARLKKWISTEEIRLLSLPTSDIAWEGVIERAVWQRPPFSRSDATSPAEKGFKDCLLLETLRHHSTELLRYAFAMFVSNDQLLRDTVSTELGGNRGLRCFESLDALGSFLRLQHETATRELADAVLEPARRAFYDADTRAGLYFSVDVPGQLAAKFAAHFDDPTLSEPPSIFGVALKRRKGPFPPSWMPVKDGFWRVDDPVFVALHTPERLRWRSEVRFYRLYSRPPGQGLFSFGYSSLGPPPLPPPEPEYRYLFLPFSVTWLATLSGDGSLSGPVVEDLAMAKGAFEELADEESASSPGV